MTAFRLRLTLDHIAHCGSNHGTDTVGPGEGWGDLVNSQLPTVV